METYDTDIIVDEGVFSSSVLQALHWPDQVAACLTSAALAPSPPRDPHRINGIDNELDGWIVSYSGIFVYQKVCKV